MDHQRQSHCLIEFRLCRNSEELDVSSKHTMASSSFNCSFFNGFSASTLHFFPTKLNRCTDQDFFTTVVYVHSATRLYCFLWLPLNLSINCDLLQRHVLYWLCPTACHVSKSKVAVHVRSAADFAVNVFDAFLPHKHGPRIELFFSEILISDSFSVQETEKCLLQVLMLTPLQALLCINMFPEIFMGSWRTPLKINRITLLS